MRQFYIGFKRYGKITFIVLLIMTLIYAFVARYMYKPINLDISTYFEWVQAHFNSSHYTGLGIQIIDDVGDSSWHYRSYKSFEGTNRDIIADHMISDMYCVTPYYSSYYCYLNIETGVIKNISISGDSRGVVTIMYPRNNISYSVGDIVLMISEYENHPAKIYFNKSAYCHVDINSSWRVYTQGTDCHNIIMRQIKYIYHITKPDYGYNS